MQKPKLFILDLMALVFRGYYAFSYKQLTTSNGIPVTAIFVTTQFLINLIKTQKPDYMVIATDSKEPTIRHQIYPQYKANRAEMPEDLSTQLPYIFKLIEALKIKLLKIPGIEADDIIGSIVNKYKQHPIDIYIVSGDKDFMQLLDDNVFMYTAKKNDIVEIITPQTVKKKFSCTPQNIVDLLALIGDASDNIPGVPGIGEKGAIKLISQFNNIENIYKNIKLIQNTKQKEALKKYQDLAKLSKKLITINTNIALDLKLEDIKINPTTTLANYDLLNLFKELEFKKLANNILKNIQDISNTQNTHQSSNTQSIITVNTSYHLINELSKFENFMSYIINFPQYAFDTETTGLDIIKDFPIGLSFAVKEKEAFYIPLHTPHLKQNLTKELIISKIQTLYKNQNILKIAHNAKFDIQMLWNIDCTVESPIADTLIASYLLDPTNKSHSLDHCCIKYLNYTKIPTSSLIGKDAHINMRDVDISKLTQYACEDADLTLQLYKKLEPELLAQNLDYVFTEIEMPLVKVLADIEKNGVYINKEMLSQLSQEIEIKLHSLETEIYALAQEEFNINSPKQLQVILFDKLKVHEKANVKLKKTKTGYSTDVSMLEKLSSEPIIQKILEYRTLIKLKTTYVDTLPYLVHPITQRLHTTFHQTGTATGRLSSTNPNLQNIPIRSSLGKQIRSAFCTQDQASSVIVSADYSQIELRILAHLSEDPNLLTAFEEEQDIHKSTASKIFGVSIDNVTDDMRQKAKAINFGIIYGMGPKRLAKETGVSFNMAKDFIDKYFANFSSIKTYIEKTIQFAKDRGYCQTISGRKRPIPEIFSTDPVILANAEHISINSPIQGSAADLIKIAMIKIYNTFKQKSLKSKIILQIHDELLFECPTEELTQVKNIIKETMQNAVKLKVKLIVDIGYGKNWLEAH